ncbi:MAG: hypothetical protein Crog4KO_19020 [Crocinitomicaceae bacterium]
MNDDTFDESEFNRRNKQLGDRIKELRMKAGDENAEQFAYKHGISRVSYWRAEQGKSNTTLRILYLICQAHSISLAELFMPLNEKFEKYD